MPPDRFLEQLAGTLRQFAEELLSAIRGASHAELDRLCDRLPSLTGHSPPHTPPGLPLSLLDLGGILLVGMAALWGGGRGLVGSLIDLAAVGAGVWAGRSFGTTAAELAKELFQTAGLAQLAPLSAPLGYGAAFLTAFLPLTIIAGFIHRRIQPSILGWLDLAGGLLLGAILGGALFQACADALQTTSWGKPLVAHSRFLPAMSHLLARLAHIKP
ncbi:MAG TPA: hypothetical protein EYP09_06835 [Anaerolineae bacterium]|nr:hypothetical protein [Anaerolineae bacterium]